MAEQSIIDKDALIAELLASINQHKFAPDVAHIEIHGNEVLNRNLVDGLIVESQSLEDGVSVRIRNRRRRPRSIHSKLYLPKCNQHPTSHECRDRA